jgi:hypothetical protein
MILCIRIIISYIILYNMIALNIMIRYNEFKIGLRSKLVRASHLRSDMGGRLDSESRC